MTARDAVLQMSEDELRVSVAVEVMGYEYSQTAPDGRRCQIYGKNKGWWREPGSNGWACAACEVSGTPPDYPHDLNACYAAEAELEKRFQMYYYVSALRELLGIPSEIHGSHFVWQLLHASPVDRCRALVLAVREGRQG